MEKLLKRVKAEIKRQELTLNDTKKKVTAEPLASEWHFGKMMRHAYMVKELKEIELTILMKPHSETMEEAALRYAEVLKREIMSGNVRSSSTNEIRNHNTQVAFEVKRIIYNWINNNTK